MRAPAFTYARPGSVDEALRLLAEHGDAAKLLAGGQSLIPLLNFRLARPDHLIDIGRLEDLKEIRAWGDGLAIGALATQAAIEGSSLVKERCPLLHEAIGHVGHAQTRHRGTLGGSLAHADPAAELPAVVAATGADLVIRGAQGERTLQAAAFFTGYLTTAMTADELLVEVRFPAWPRHTGSAFVEFAHRAGDYAIVGAAALLALDAAGAIERVGLALIGVGGRPFDAAAIVAPLLAGRSPDEAALQAAAKAAAQAVQPDSDVHAPADYKRHLAGVLTGRALAIAARRAQATRGEG